MSRTLLAGFRGADGRSLARALAILLVVAGFLGAIDSGRMTADAGGASVICTTHGAAAAGPGNPGRPAREDHCLCCAFGCTGSAPGALTTDVDRLPAGPARGEVGTPAATTIALAIRRPPAAGPRGPPGLA